MDKLLDNCHHNNVCFCSTAIVGGKFELVTEVSIVNFEYLIQTSSCISECNYDFNWLFHYIFETPNLSSCNCTGCRCLLLVYSLHM